MRLIPLGNERTVGLNTVLVPALDPGLLVIILGLATGRTGLTDIGLNVIDQTGLQCQLPHRLVVWMLRH